MGGSRREGDMRHNDGNERARLLDNQLRWAARQWRRAVHDGDGRHDSGKGQQGDRMHNDFDGRHDDDKGQQGNRRHNDGDERAG